VSSAKVEALLDAAEAEFADAGIETGSLRKIMRAAGADPGAVHYHFGGRQALAAAVLDRVLAPLNARRLELLNRVTAERTPSTADLVEALVRPDIEAAHELHGRSPGRARLLAAVYLHPNEFVETAVAQHFGPVAAAFQPHLEAALPHVPFSAIAWRVRWCVYGTVGALLAHQQAMFERDREEMIAELVEVLTSTLGATTP
jgi:AcrR family transcriptional regulator